MTTHAAKKGVVSSYAVGIVVAVGFFLAMIVPAIQRAKRAGELSLCNKNLMHIAMALTNYHDTNGCYPPPFVADRAGKPLYSWRVLIAPQLEGKQVYSQFHLDEPWNSEHNRRFAELMPEAYRCPTDAGVRKGETSYMAVVGPHTVWPGGKPVTQKEITDGASCTIFVVEVAGSGVNWMEPRDLTFDEAAAGVTTDWKSVSPGRTLGIRSRHRFVTNCVFPDASTHMLWDGISPELLKGLLTRDGGEDVTEFERAERHRLESQRPWSD
jgi:hypothetical protein